MPDIPYNRPGGVKQYISITKHQKNARNNHAKWISVPIENVVFDNADYGNFAHILGDIEWSDLDGNLWGLLQNYDSVGTLNEQFGFFVKPNNEQDRWHGYPIVPFSTEKYKISPELIDLWVKKNIIDVDDVPHLLRKKRIG